MARAKRQSTEITKIFADRLSDLVDEKKRKDKLTHEQIATGMGIASGSLSEWCSDKKTPDITKIPLITAYFGVSADWLLGRSDVRSPDVNLQGAHRYTGLTERTIAGIKETCTDGFFNDEGEFSELLEVLFTNGEFKFLLHKLFALYVSLKAQKIDSCLYAEIMAHYTAGRNWPEMDMEETARCARLAQAEYYVKIDEILAATNLSNRVKACIRASNAGSETAAPTTGVDFYDYLFGADRYHINQYKSLVIESIVAVIDDLERRKVSL